MIIYQVYEGPELFGLFSSIANAEKFMEEYPKNYGIKFNFEIVEYKLDQELDDFL